MKKKIIMTSGLTKYGVRDIPPLVGSGVVLDMAKNMGKKVLDAGEHFSEKKIKAAAKAQGVKIGKGDIVLFHKGWTDVKTQK